jgi:catechol 2,3-dioxygenase-like lactoylglutathione lyase family enzyme
VKIQHLRIARPTARLAEIAAFYQNVLAFERIAAFVDHEGFDGVMLGRSELAFHLEFTHERGTARTPAPSREHALVLYLEEGAWLAMRARIETLGIATVVSHNPYWDRHGMTIEDPDGNTIVLHRGVWKR